MNHIIFLNQFGFIKGRHIKDCIDAAFDCVNIMNRKCFGGNMVVRIDIRKAFDTLR